MVFTTAIGIEVEEYGGSQDTERGRCTRGTFANGLHEIHSGSASRVGEIVQIRLPEKQCLSMASAIAGEISWSLAIEHV